MEQVLIEPQIVVLEEDEVFYIPDNCWAVVEEGGKNRLVRTKTVSGKQVKKLKLLPKVAGG